MQLIQIVPGLPPMIDGIGDYALQLARRLLEEQGIETRFLVGDHCWDGPTEIEGFAVSKVQARSERGLLAGIAELERGLGESQILVQFSVYGYERRGCPFWMAAGLESLHRTRPKGVHVAFHELENRSWKPWSSVFWVSGLQKSLIKRIARISTFRYTNTAEYQDRLAAWGLGCVELIPNFSTLGEPTMYPAFEERQPEIVIFGRGAQRRWTYERGGHLLARLCQRLGAERIVDIGQPLDDTPAAFGDIPVVRLGRLPEDELNDCMAKAIGSFMQYPVPLLTKSSVHAVSCAFGTPVFVFDEENRGACPPLVPGEDFIPVDEDFARSSLPPLAELSQRAFENYQQRSSRKAAGIVARHLNGQTE